MPQLAGIRSTEQFIFWFVIFHVRNLVEDVISCRFVKLTVFFQLCLQLPKAYYEVVQRWPAVGVSNQNETQKVYNGSIVV